MSMSQKLGHTPLMKQYHSIKAEHSDALLMFQVGDFYELFFDDAKKAANCLGIALTTRGKSKGEPIPLCGVPLHALDHYMIKLVKAGFNVAICDQLEQPIPGKVVERGVTNVLTPGTLTDAKLLDEKSASYLFSFFPAEDSWGLLFGELLTAQLFATILPAQSEKQLEAELVRFFPDEILVPNIKKTQRFVSQFKQRGYFTTFVDTPAYDSEQAKLCDQWLNNQFRQASVRNINKSQALYSSVYTFFTYLRRNQEAALSQFHNLHFYQPEDFLLLDPATQRNLELVKSVQDSSRKSTLFSVMDHAVTAMGSRMIKKWLLRPLVKKEPIVHRQDVIAQFLSDAAFLQKIQQNLSRIGDIERVIGRIALRRAPIHDYIVLMHALCLLPRLKNLLLEKTDTVLLSLITKNLGDFKYLHQLLVAALHDESEKNWVIKKGFDQELDRLRKIVEKANQSILALERREQEVTGIHSLKIRFNGAHGYYIEVTKSNLGTVPERYKRKQTLVGKERFITPELLELQQEIFTARNEIDAVEKLVFERIKRDTIEHIGALRKCAHALAHLDALLSFGKLAYNNGYVRPRFNTTRTIIIEDGRHPVVEASISNSFIPNNTRLTDQESLWIITGPNMGGKSTYLRQVALISIMAQCGSFVPASKAHLPLLDRIFTRIGAGDNLAEGKSTFLVEMEETAAICTQATKNSLVILDEIGRGTSTFDGLAIAHAVIEYLYQKVQARCLFATHYHELTLLSDQFPGIASYYAASRRGANFAIQSSPMLLPARRDQRKTSHHQGLGGQEEGIIFLYKIVKGIADGSFGLEVAKLAQLPQSIIKRAREVLHTLSVTNHGCSSITGKQEAGKVSNDLIKARRQIRELRQQLKEIGTRLQPLQDIDYDTLSPRQAFDLLWNLREGL